MALWLLAEFGSLSNGGALGDLQLPVMAAVHGLLFKNSQALQSFSKEDECKLLLVCAKEAVLFHYGLSQPQKLKKW